MLVSLVGFAVLLFLIMIRMPIGIAMGLVGFFGFAWLNDWNWTAALSMSARRLIDTARDYSLTVIPLFILMGNFVTKSGLSHELYRASYAFMGHLRGGLAMATVVACGGFSAICGSSLATAATMSKVSMPPMRKYGYSDALATASIAAGGTLGILIPPSVILLIYGIMTEQSIRELFAAGFLPGMLGILLYVGAVAWTVWRNPKAGPPGERSTGVKSAWRL
ncbi:MAG: TRAP transporter large permease subunit [Thiolinea sp.]